MAVRSSRSPAQRIEARAITALGLGLLAMVPAGVEAEEMRLEDYANRAGSCVAGASPLPLAVLSLAGGSLGRTLKVLDAETDAPRLEVPDAADALDGDNDGRIALALAGFPAAELLIPVSAVGIPFTVDCPGGGGVTFRFAELEVAIGLSAAHFGGDAPLFGPLRLELDVAYAAGAENPSLRFRRLGGGAGPLELPLAAPFSIDATGVRVLDGARLTLPASVNAGSLASLSFAVADVRLEFTGFLSFLNEVFGAAGPAFTASLDNAGLSGVFAYLPDPPEAASLFGEEFRLERLRLEFQENAIAAASIRGGWKPPFFKEYLTDCDGYAGLDLALQQDGEVRTAFAPCTGSDPLHLALDGVFDLAVSGVDFERHGDDYRFRLDGELTLSFLGALDGVDLGGGEIPRVAIERLTVSSSGEVSLDGGWVRLPAPAKFSLHGFEVEVRGVSFASTGGLTWIELDADISLTDILPLNGSVHGFQAFWENADPLGTLDIDMEGIRIAYREPGVASFEGSVRREGSLFQGSVRLDIEAISLSVDAAMTIGREDGMKFFFIQLFSEFPAGVPIFSGVSLYGIGGLFASNLEPNVEGFPAPLIWYAEHEERPGEVTPEPAPWLRRQGALSFGAGALIGSSDDGYAVHAKAALIVSIPGPLIAFTGKANLLASRGGFAGSGDDPVFTAAAIYTPRSFELGVGAHYGAAGIVDIRGDAEAFFDFEDPANWHIYLGQKLGGREIRANVADLFDAKAYFMIHPAAIDLALAGGERRPDLAFGAGIDFDESFSVGPLGIAFRALIQGDAALSFKPIHLQGGLDLEGGVDLFAFGFATGLDVGAALAFQTPTPLLIDGQVHVRLSLPWPLPDPEATVHFRWDDIQDPPPVDPVLLEVQLTARDGSHGVPAFVAAGPDLPADYFAGMAPVAADFVPALVFARPMNDATLPPFLGGGDAAAIIEDLVREDGDGFAEVRYLYALSALEVSSAPYDPEALEVTGAFEPVVLPGVWLPEARRLPEGGIEAYPSRTLVLLDQNPFSRFAASGWEFVDAGGERLGMARWLHKHACEGCPCFPCRRRQSPQLPCGGCPDPGLDPCLLVPNRVYRLHVQTKTYRGVAEVGSRDSYLFFHTASPPLDLAPYVHEMAPAAATRPYFRDYDLAVRFNQGYIDFLYSAPEDAAGLLCGGTPALCGRILDAERNSLAGCGLLTASFSEAADHIEPAHEGRDTPGPVAFYKALGGAVLDDDVLHLKAAPGRLRPGERHIAQVLWPANDPDARVAIHQFPFLASRFTDLDALLATFAERGEEGCTGGHRGTYFHLDADGASEAAWNAAAGILDELADFRAAHAGAEASFARRLRDARPSFSPREVDDRALAVLLRRAERLVQCLDDGDDDPETCDEGDLLAGIDLEAIREGWELERAAFERLDDYLGLDRHRQPFPEVAELSAVRRGRVPRGFLLELPEPLDWERIAVLAVTLDGAVLDLLAVKDAAGARIFLIPIAGGAIGELDEGLYRIEMTFQGELAGWRAPALQRAGGAEPANVTAAICFELGRDLHVP